jgi:hypothetical protein
MGCSGLCGGGGCRYEGFVGGIAQMVTAITMRLAPFSFMLTLLACLVAGPVLAFTDDELIDGFDRTVFGSEYQGFGWQSHLVKKYTVPVRLFVDDRSKGRRGGEVARFVRTLPRLISGLDIGVVASSAKANFRVYVIDRADYVDVVGREIYGRPSSSFAPGKCLVRVVSTSAGITRSDAVIVADDGDFLFQRCTVEEVLQGLGPINDDATLDESVFNDRSHHSTFTSFDRHILNMLYNPLVEPGMTKLEVARVLPKVAAEVQASLR